MIALGMLRFVWWRDRVWITLPPNNPYVQLLAGRRKGAIVTLVIDASECREEDAKRLHNVTISYRATITKARRSDGLYWFKVVVPLNIARMLLFAKDCIKAQVFLEPAPVHEKMKS
jgi:hypothetical protein